MILGLPIILSSGFLFEWNIHERDKMQLTINHLEHEYAKKYEEIVSPKSRVKIIHKNSHVNCIVAIFLLFKWGEITWGGNEIRIKRHFQISFNVWKKSLQKYFLDFVSCYFNFGDASMIPINLVTWFVQFYEYCRSHNNN